VSTWHDIAAELGTMPDVIERLSEIHRLTVDGRYCRACTTPGGGTPMIKWPCPMATLAADASRSAPTTPRG
jgi:hypothetical protein